MTSPIAIVTGAPGWLGTRLVETLVRGMAEVAGLESPLPDREIRCLVLPGHDAAPLRNLSKGVKAFTGDVRDTASLSELFKGARGATVFHCAGVVHPTRGVKEFYEVNARGTENMLAAAKSAGARRFVHVSSNSPIGCNPARNHLFDESSPFNPYMNYGGSKKLAEEAIAAASREGALQTVVIRPPWFYGPGQPARQTLFFSMIKNGTVPVVGDGGNPRSMAYIDNICQGLLLCEKVEKATGQTYWIADRRPYTMNEVVDTIDDLLVKEFGIQTKGGRRHLPGFASEVAYVLDKTLQSIGLYHQKIHVLSEMNKTIACSVTKAERELGYNPRIDLREGMKRSIRWMLDRGIQI